MFEPGDLVQFKSAKHKYLPYVPPQRVQGRTDHLGQFIPEHTKGIIIGAEWIDRKPGEPDPLNEYPYQIFTILTNNGVRTPGWTENVFDMIAKGRKIPDIDDDNNE